MAEKLQIRLEFNPVEDRLLLRISVREGSKSCVEYRLWISRRFAYIFLQAIDKLIEDELAADMQVSSEAREAMKKFQKEAALAKADFSTSYGSNGADCKLFDEQPLLVVTLNITKKAKGKFTLSLLDKNNAGIHLTADLDLIHTLQKMLMDAVSNAGWNKPLFKVEESEPETLKPAGYIS